MFREPKPAAGFYKSQCDPEEEIVLEPAFHWARSDESVGFTRAVFCSNCDHIEISAPMKVQNNAWVQPGDRSERTEFDHLKYPPFALDLEKRSEQLQD
jgi:beta-galactosidase